MSRRLDLLDASRAVRTNLRKVQPHLLGVSTAHLSMGGFATAQAGTVTTLRPLVIMRQLLQRVGKVVVFSGHTIDRPWDNPAARRFPVFPPHAQLEARVQEAISEALERIQPVAGFCFVSCGSDIIFAERMLKRQAEVHVVIPFKCVPKSAPRSSADCISRSRAPLTLSLSGFPRPFSPHSP